MNNQERQALIEWAKKWIVPAKRTVENNQLDASAKASLKLYEIALAALEAPQPEPIGKVVLGEYDDCGMHPDAKVVCLHEHAGWDNFPDGTELYTAPPAPVMRLVKLPEWTDTQCLEFISIAFRHAEISGDIEIDDIRLGMKMVNSAHPVEE